MIEIIEGRGVGAGKSYMIMTRLLPHWIQGGTACVSDSVVVKWDECKAYAKRRAGVLLEDDQYRIIAGGDVQRLHEVTPPGTGDLPVILVVDEAQDAFNARDWNDKGKRGFFAWLCQSRHDDNDVIIISQAAANVDKQVRRLATFNWVTRNTATFPIAGTTLSKLMSAFTFGLWDGQVFIWTQLDQDGRTPLAKKWHRADKGLFGCYVSKAMKLAHRRLGDEVARKKLEKVKREGMSPMIKFGMIALVAVVAIGGWRMHSASKARHEQTSTNQLVSPSGGIVKKHYKVVTVTGLGTYGMTLCTEELGNLEQGQLCSLGMVEVVKRGRARVLSPEGELVYVVAVGRSAVGNIATAIGAK